MIFIQIKIKTSVQALQNIPGTYVGSPQEEKTLNQILGTLLDWNFGEKYLWKK